MTIVHLPLQKLVPDPTQPRQACEPSELQQLAASIRERGVLLPLRVKPADAQGRHVIVSGHRRYAASQSLGLTDVPCIIVDGPLDQVTILAEQIAENVHRENLSPIEEAQAYRRYLTLRSCTATQAAQELAVPATRISRALPLLELPAEVQAVIHAGKLSGDAAYHLTRLPEGEARSQLFEQAIAGTLSRDAAARAVKATQGETKETPSISRVSFKLADNRTLTLSAPAVRLDLFIETVEEVLREARKARSQNLDVSTLAKMFRDRTGKGGAE